MSESVQSFINSFLFDFFRLVTTNSAVSGTTESEQIGKTPNKMAGNLQYNKKADHYGSQRSELY